MYYHFEFSSTTRFTEYAARAQLFGKDNAVIPGYMKC